MGNLAIILCLLNLGAESLPASERADILLARARSRAVVGSTAEAASLCEEARLLYDGVGDLAGQGAVDVLLSDLAVRSGSLAAAVRHRQNAYSLFRRAGKGFSQALTLRELACLSWASREFARAEEMLERTIRMFEYLEAPQEAHRAGVLLLGVLGADPEAEPGRIIQNARWLLRATGPRPSPEISACAYDGLGAAYVTLGDYGTALDCYEKAREQAVAGQLPEGLREMAQANRGSALVYAGRAREAAETHEDLARKRLVRGEREKALNSLANASVAWRYVGDLDRADKCLAAAEGMFSPSQLPPDIRARLELNRGRIEFERGRWLSACERYQRALELLPATSQDLWRFRYFYAQALEKRGDDSGAEQQLRIAADRLEKNRHRSTEFRQRAAYYESRGDVFAQLVSLLMRRGKPGEALEVVERHRARCFLDLLASPSRGSVPGSAAGSQDGVESMAQLGRLATAAGDDRTRGFLDSLKEGAPKPAESPQGKSAAAALQDADPLPPSERPRSLLAIQAALRSTECILEFYLCRDTGYAFLIAREALHSWQFAIGRDRISALTREWRHEIEVQRQGQGDGQPTAAEAALSEALLSPAWDTLTSGRYKTVYVAGDGPLHYVPFHALRGKRGENLLRHLAVAYVPSASSFVLLSERPRRGSATELLAIANPASDLPPLPSALHEAHSVGEHFERTVLLAGKQATKAAVLEALPRCDAVLFAVHGKMDPVVPTQSTLFLAGESESPSARLTVSEIARLQLRARLAILSACESGLVAGRTGQFPMGDDVEGLARAFLLAGVPTVLASLWHVPDEATARLISDFVRNLKEPGVSPAEALRRAQRRALGAPDARSRAPYHWAGLALYGLDR